MAPRMMGMGLMDGHEMVWHYTSFSGLLGILRTRQLHASNARYLNDTSEGDFGAECLQDAIMTYRAAQGVPPDEITRKRRVGNENRIKRMMRSEQCYIACFCRSGDLLSQWRGYADGAGCALGFSIEKLPSETEKGGEVRGVDVAYGEDEGVAYIANLMLDPKRDSTLTLGEMRAISRQASACKHDAFRAESEYRLYAAAPPDCPSLGVRGGRVIPYVHFPFDVNAIRYVKIGPGPLQEENKRALKLGLKSLGFAHVQVDVSSVPYR